jgi:hypothetical protein
MNTSQIVSVNTEGKLEISPEMIPQLRPGDRYRLMVTETEIVFRKIAELKPDLDNFLKELEELEPDPNQPTLEEISQIVKEVRQELWSK